MDDPQPHIECNARFAVKVHNGQMPSEDNYSEHVFLVIYRSVEQYFRKSKESDS